MKISNKIRQMRIKAGFTQEQLASRLGVSAQSVSKWENEISMPDITLLPSIADTFGISIDELFDLTTEQKLKRIENRIEIEEELPNQIFLEYEEYLKGQLGVNENKVEVLSLLAHLYHHRMEADSLSVAKYAKEAILLDPAKKDCQWLLDKAEGHAIWDWNIANHSCAIDFYKEVVESDKISPKASLPYYYLIDNLLADNRADEAAEYLKIFATLPSANHVMVDVYKAYIALARYNVAEADRIIESCIEDHPTDCGYLFEAAQYYARKCNYERALELYKRSWEQEKAPRFYDTLQGIAIIYRILGDKEKTARTYDEILDCLRTDWGYSRDDKPYIMVEREKSEAIK